MGLPAEELEKVAELERGVADVDAAEVRRLDIRNRLESYIYQVRGWLSGKDGELLQPAALGPRLDEVQLWFEDAEYSEEETTYEAYAAKLEDVQEFVQREGAAYFEKQVRDREAQEKAIEEATEAERQRRKDLGMDEDKDDRRMRKEDRLRLAAKNKDEGNDMFKASKFDDAIRRYKKAIDHVSRPEAVSNMTPDEASEAKKIKLSCHANCTMCYLKGADKAQESGGKDAAEPFYKKAKTACEEVLDLDPENIKALFRRGLCWEKLGEFEHAAKDVKKALDIAPDNTDLQKSQERLQKLLQRQKEVQKKVYAKMFG